MNTVPGDRLFSSLRCISFDAFCRMDALMSSVGASVRATFLSVSSVLPQHGELRPAI